MKVSNTIANLVNFTKLQKYIVPAALLGLTLSVTAAQAAPPHNIDKREHEQHKRIVEGRKSGALTHAESLRLRAREAQTRHQEARYRHSGGKLTTAERIRLEHGLNHDSKAIYHQKHDPQHHYKH